LVEKVKEHNPAVALHLVKGSGHFFEGHLDELKQAITDWIKSLSADYADPTD
jgi:alpha/beta superfamily hydrolase